MSSNIVIVIVQSEDGDTSISRMTKAEFLAKLKQNHWGEDRTFAPAGTIPDLTYFDGIIVVEGDVVVPRPVQVVTEFTL